MCLCSKGFHVKTSLCSMQNTFGSYKTLFNRSSIIPVYRVTVLDTLWPPYFFRKVVPAQGQVLSMDINRVYNFINSENKGHIYY